MLRKFKKDQTGFGLVELMITLILTSLLLVGAYKSFGTNINASQKSIQNTADYLNYIKAAAQMQAEISNVFALVGGESSLTSNVTSLTCGQEKIVSSIQPFPGKTVEDFKLETSLPTPIDPSNPSLVNGKSNDAMRIVYLDSDAKPYALAVDSKNITLSTKNKRAVTLQGPHDIQVGDFVLISDNLGSDFFRVTAVTSGDKLEFSTQSVWNPSAIKRDYGTMGSGAVVQRIHIATYAYSSTEKAVFRNDHMLDDTFSPVRLTMGQAGFGSNWVRMTGEIQGMQLLYVVEDDFNPRKTREIRTPRIGTIAQENDPKNNSFCGNQLGQPYLRDIVISLDTPKKKMRFSAEPKGLLDGRITYDAFQTIELPSEVIAGPTLPPTPTSTPSPTPSPIPTSVPTAAPTGAPSTACTGYTAQMTDPQANSRSACAQIDIESNYDESTCILTINITTLSDPCTSGISTVTNGPATCPSTQFRSCTSGNITFDPSRLSCTSCTYAINCQCLDLPPIVEGGPPFEVPEIPTPPAPPIMTPAPPVTIVLPGTTPIPGVTPTPHPTPTPPPGPTVDVGPPIYGNPTGGF